MLSKFEGTKMVLKAKKDKQFKCHKKRKKRTNNDPQNTTRIPLKFGGEIRCSEWFAAHVPLVASVVLILSDKNLIWYGNLIYYIFNIKYIKLNIFIYRLVSFCSYILIHIVIIIIQNKTYVVHRQDITDLPTKHT
jgi:hypothetical protein